MLLHCFRYRKHIDMSNMLSLLLREVQIKNKHSAIGHTN